MPGSSVGRGLGRAGPVVVPQGTADPQDPHEAADLVPARPSPERRASCHSLRIPYTERSAVHTPSRVDNFRQRIGQVRVGEVRLRHGAFLRA